MYKRQLAKFFDKKGNPNKEAQARMDAGKKKREVAAKVKDVTPKGYGPSEEVEKEALDTWHPDPAKDRKSTSMKHTAKSVAHQAAQKKKPATFATIDTRQAAAKVQDILRKQRERKAAAKKNEDIVKGIPVSKKMAGTTVPPKQAPRADRMDKSKNLLPAPGWKTRKAGTKAGDMTTENLEFKVKIKGIPSFYVPAKTAAKVKQSLRKQLKHPDDIESITRVTKAAQKIDFRLRAQGKGEKEEDNKK